MDTVSILSWSRWLKGKPRCLKKTFFTLITYGFKWTKKWVVLTRWGFMPYLARNKGKRNIRTQTLRNSIIKHQSFQPKAHSSMKGPPQLWNFMKTSICILLD